MFDILNFWFGLSPLTPFDDVHKDMGEYLRNSLAATTNKEKKGTKTKKIYANLLLI